MCIRHISATVPQGTRACTDLAYCTTGKLYLWYLMRALALIKGPRPPFVAKLLSSSHGSRSTFAPMLVHLGALGRHLGANVSQHCPKTTFKMRSWSQHGSKQMPQTPQLAILCRWLLWQLDLTRHTKDGEFDYWNDIHTLWMNACKRHANKAPASNQERVTL